jgi:putative ABC transport system ATP-binding protein
VWVDGREVNRMSEQKRLALRRDTVAFIFQAFGLVPMLSAAENVGIPLRIAGLRPSERRERVAAMLALTGLSSHAVHRPDELSGGARPHRRLAGPGRRSGTAIVAAGPRCGGLVRHRRRHFPASSA